MINKRNFKKSILAYLLLVASLGLAQNGINYKALLKDANGNVVTNELITVEIIIQKGTAMSTVYEESHDLTTNDNGIFILSIGEGVPGNGFDFNSIDWASDEHYLQVLVEDDAGNFGLIDFGTTKFNAVPYAKNAETANNVVWTQTNENISNVNNGGVGIGTDEPVQKLSVNGKISLGNDATAPTSGTLRFNENTNIFEGFNGTEWVSMTYKPKVYAYEQHPVDDAYSSNIRDQLISFPDVLTISEPGKYICFFDITFFNLKGNATTLSSDSSLYLELQVYNRVEFENVGPNITGLPAGFTYYFRTREHVQFHRIIDIPTANQTMQFRYRLNSNSCCAPRTDNYSIRDVRMIAIKLD